MAALERKETFVGWSDRYKAVLKQGNMYPLRGGSNVSWRLKKPSFLFDFTRWCNFNPSVRKKADISGRHHWFPRKIISKNRAQKFHTDDASLIGYAWFFWMVEANSAYPDLGSDASSVWNFCCRFSDIIWRWRVVASRNVSFISQGISPLTQYIALCKTLMLTLDRGGVGGWLPRILTDPFPSANIDCDFEKGFCGWTNNPTDDFDWRRRSGHTPTAGTGPSFDHTKGRRGWYITYYKIKR